MDIRLVIGFEAETAGRGDLITRFIEPLLPCHKAGEVISTVQMVMQAQMPYTVLRDGVLTHPTMTEGLNLLFSKV